MNPPSRRASDGGQGRLRKPRPVGPVGSCLEPEILGAPEHLRCANLVCSQPMPDLSAISRNTLEMQQRHEGFEPRIGWSRAVGFSAHLRSPGLRRVRRAACVNDGCWFDSLRIRNRHPTVAIARRDEARCHELAQQGETCGLRAIACRRGAAGVVAVHRGDCDGLAIGDCDGWPLMKS